MQFLFPAFLFAGLTIAIPIIIHLFYFRRFKKVYFTNVRFLKEVKEETSARSRLRNLLVLLMRVMAILALVLAFAQPFISNGKEIKKGSTAVSVFVDNSFSMAAESAEVPLLEKAKQRAREIIQAYTPDDRFQVLTNDFEGRHQRLVSQEDALAFVDEIQPTPSVQTLSDALNRQHQALKTGKADQNTAYAVSDFQKNMADIANYTDTTMEVQLAPLQAVREQNVSIDSVWFEAPVQLLNETSTLIVKLRNWTDETADNVRLSLEHDGQNKPIGTVSIPAKGSILDTIQMTILHAGWHKAHLSITDYPIQFDDHYYFSFEVAEKISVLLVSEGKVNSYLKAAFGGSLYQLKEQNLSNIDYANLNTFNLVVLQEPSTVSSGLSSALKKYAEAGGNIVLFPNVNADKNTYNAFLRSMNANELGNYETAARTAASINTDAYVFRDVYINKNANLKLPTSSANFVLGRVGNRGEEKILTYRDGSTYIGQYQLGQGNLFVSAAPLDPSINELPKQGEIFVPMLFRMSISARKGQNIAYTIGQDQLIELKHNGGGSEMVYKLKGAKENFIPGQRIVNATLLLDVHQQIPKDGFYQLYMDGKDSLAVLSFNYDRRESDLDYVDETFLSASSNPAISVIAANDKANFQALIGESGRGTALWKWCLFAALLFLLAEVLLLRFWRV